MRATVTEFESEVQRRVGPKGAEVLLVKQKSAQGGCLGMSRRGRTWQAAKSFGELQASEDPEMSEWGNPAWVILRHRESGANPGN